VATLLELEGVNAHYGKSHVLQDVSLHVEPGEVVALLGRNGSGRSTTLKAVMGLVSVKSGVIRFSGKPVTNRPTFDIAKLGIALVPEDRRVFVNLTVAENLRLATLSGRKGPWNQARIYDFFPVLGERRDRPAKLSGGEQQMLAIARALVANPEIVLLDEPMEGLAPLIARSVEDVVRRIREEGTTILLVEQNAHVAMSLSDRGYILSNGRVLAGGTIAELRRDEAAMQRYLSV